MRGCGKDSTTVTATDNTDSTAQKRVQSDIVRLPFGISDSNFQKPGSPQSAWREYVALRGKG